MNKKTLLVGTGYMSKEYLKVLQYLNQPFDVAGNTEATCIQFQDATGTEALPNGMKTLFSRDLLKEYNTAIIATTEDRLKEMTIVALESGIKNILLEKPGGVSVQELFEIKELAAKKNADVHLAYNRRFYNSTRMAKDIIENDGGVVSFLFEFSEVEGMILELNKPDSVKAFWFMTNPSHPADLAFYLGGKPKEFNGYCIKGELWYQRSYAGYGITENEAMFSYYANWNAPGRWNVEASTRNFRIIMKPLEELRIQRLNSFSVDKIESPDDEDILFKPGLLKQTKAFLAREFGDFLSIIEHCEMLKVYEKMNEGF